MADISAGEAHPSRSAPARTFTRFVPDGSEEALFHLCLLRFHQQSYQQVRPSAGKPSLRLTEQFQYFPVAMLEAANPSRDRASD